MAKRKNNIDDIDIHDDFELEDIDDFDPFDVLDDSFFSMNSRLYPRERKMTKSFLFFSLLMIKLKNPV